MRCRGWGRRHGVQASAESDGPELSGATKIPQFTRNDSTSVFPGLASREPQRMPPCKIHPLAGAFANGTFIDRWSGYVVGPKLFACLRKRSTVVLFTND